MNIKETNWKIWLIRSTFGIKEYEAEHELPKNMCEFVKLFVISIVLFPFALLSHGFNLLHRDTDAKAWHGMIALFIGMVVVACCASPGDNSHPEGFLHDWLAPMGFRDKLFYTYLLGPFGLIALILVIAILILVGVGVVAPFAWMKDKYVERKYERRKAKRDKRNEETPSSTWMPEYLRSIKEKYCIKINYIK